VTEAATPLPDAPVAARRPGRFRPALRAFLASPPAAVALGVFTAMVLAAAAAPLIAPQNPYDLRSVSILDNLLPPGERAFSGMTYWLGTDGQGRDMLSAMLYGLRISLVVGFASGVVALLIGTLVGLVAAYRGGWVDAVLMRVVDLQLSFPTILVALILLVLLGRGVDKIIIALVVVQWAYFARTVRGVALVEGSRDYVEAARGLRLPPLRILLRHILPNCLPTLLVVATIQMAQAISLEATLSFLGLGLPPTRPSLGLLIANGFDYLQSGRWWISVLPGLVLLVLIVSVNVLGDRMREILNPHLRG
jgi:peptide/nickel transport system permease protein